MALQTMGGELAKTHQWERAEAVIKAVLRKWQGCGKLCVILRTERNRFHGYLQTVQMASLPSRDYFAVCPVVPAVSAQLPRSRGDDARARIACRSHDDLPLSCNITHQNWRRVADPISNQRPTRGASMRRMFKGQRGGRTSTAPWVATAAPWYF